MGSFRIFRRQAVSYIATFGLLAATIVSGFIPTLASAAQVTERSISMTSASAGADDVTYNIKFKSVGSAGAFAVFFCTNSPLLGDECTNSTTTGIDVQSATSATAGFTNVTAPDSTNKNKLVVAGTIAADTNIEVAVDGINNPTVAGKLYARIITFDTVPNATDAVATSETNAGTVDSGSVAMSIVDSVNVSGRVLETLTFCVSATAIDPGCASGVTAPTLKLGEPYGDTIALSSTVVSHGDLYAQLTTNAVDGAVVNLKSGNLCGGLKRGGTTVCDIAPAQQADITGGQAKFGLKVAADTTQDGAEDMNPNGTLQATNGYGSSAYALNYDTVNMPATSGVTSPYGDLIMNTDGGVTNNRNMILTFGASISGNTPGGNYSNDLSLVATGTF